MSLIWNAYKRRKSIDTDLWKAPDYFDLSPFRWNFDDHFEEVNRILNRHVRYYDDDYSNISKDFQKDLLLETKHTEEHQILVDCRGFHHSSIKVTLSHDRQKVIVNGHQVEKKNDENFHVNEFKKSYNLPLNADVDNIKHYFSSREQLVIIVPLKSEVKNKIRQIQIKDNDRQIFPKYFPQDDFSRKFEIKFSMPNNVDPSNIKVTYRDKDIIIECDERHDTPNGYSHTSFFRRTTLPDNIDIDSMSCSLLDNTLYLKAYIDDNNRRIRFQNY